MNLLKKLIIGALTLIVLAGPVGQGNKKEYEKSSRDYTKIERTINFDNPQETLNEAFRIANPEHLSEVIYDPDFKKSDDYVKKRLIGYSRRLTEEYIKQARTQAPGHNLCIADVFPKMGDGQKRTTFARGGILKSKWINSIEDLAICISHEDVHAKESRYGYDFGDRTIKGEELMELLEKGDLRIEIISKIGEFDAYSSQIERADKVERKPSLMNIISTTTNAYQIYSTIESDISSGTLTPLERKYAEEKIRRHKKTIETLKNYR